MYTGKRSNKNRKLACTSTIDPTAHGSIPECLISDTSGMARMNIGHPCIASSPLKTVTCNTVMSGGRELKPPTVSSIEGGEGGGRGGKR